VNDRADPADVAITRHRDVERRRESETVEAVQTRRRWAGRRARLTDVEQQRRQIDERSAGCAPDPEGVRTDLLQDTALARRRSWRSLSPLACACDLENDPR